MLVGHVGRVEPSLIGGWAADTEHPDAIIDVVIYVDGKRLARVACDVFRRDLLDLRIYGHGRHGLHYTFPTPLPLDLLDRISVRFASTGAVVPNGERILPGGEQLNAILVTAAGRSGTTFMMGRLALSPQICVAETPPFEVRLMSYWSTVVKTLTGEADHKRSMHPDRLESDGFKVGSNPFSHEAFHDAFRNGAIGPDYFEKYARSVLEDSARKLIREFYLRIKVDRPKPSAIFFAEKSNSLHQPMRLFARILFPNLKEIVLVRDPRDQLCSQLSYFRITPEQALSGIADTAMELARIKREEGESVILVRYEDMIIDSARVFAELSAQLGIEPFPAPPQPQEKAVFGVHATSASPEASIGRWRAELSTDQIVRCNAVLRPFMADLGYG